ncbi:uncharacterized protein LOC135078134 [Ostrinia nubilalis]|uniref:uncharacterized protein LOC114366403 n=1 Tax=Ostrinia furnacalis TaxID=93504 RepID=UPI0010388AA9|nr:uncharacterized protein LOC114366403 [Ostrinia furnacalis]
MEYNKVDTKMTSKFPFSMESLPRQKKFVCLSLKFGSIFAALTVILYSVLALAQCAAALGMLPNQLEAENVASMAMFGIIIVITITHAVTLFLSAVMLVGALCDRAYLIRPWVMWMSVQVMVSILLFVFYSTMNMINHFQDSTPLIYIIEFLILLVRIYMLMTVGNYYRQLVEEHGESERLVKLMNSDWYNA